VVQIASGDGGGAILRKADGSAWSCSSYTPLLGRGEKYGTLNDALTPKPIPGLTKGVIDVAHGSSSMLALTEDDSVWTWGKNLNHTLDIVGLAYEHIQWTPKKTDLPAGPPIVDVEIDYSSTAFATRADGSVIVWGRQQQRRRRRRRPGVQDRRRAHD